MPEYSEEKILSFIAHFQGKTGAEIIIDRFTSGCCYWFAFILCSRFPNARMMYDPVVNHFMAEIDGRLYDITGDVTGKYNVIPWDQYDSIFQDSSEKERIKQYCIDFTKD